MINSATDFPFRQLKVRKYLTLEIMLHVDYPDILTYMYAVNRATRSYIESNLKTIRNGFINAGLITYQLKTNDFNHYY